MLRFSSVIRAVFQTSRAVKGTFHIVGFKLICFSGQELDKRIEITLCRCVKYKARARRQLDWLTSKTMNCPSYSSVRVTF